MTQDALDTLALTRLNGLTKTAALAIIQQYGSASNALQHIQEMPQRVQTAFKAWSEAIHRAETELEFCQKKGIQVLTHQHPDYPMRLTQCPDFPLVLFYKGSTSLNAKRIISVVGTRHISDYGKEICHNFIHELSLLLPDVVIVSGLAYGVDIHAHRAALERNLPTVGVLAHGLDRIYPTLHRTTAKEMIENGGLLTEYMTETNPDKGNFVRRNRIVAGMSDATIVVESAIKGGALITANLALDYNRDVFAFPGRVSDKYSEGCNQLIADNKAGLITSAENFAKAMGWETAQKQKVVQQELFPTLTAEEELICQTLENSEGMTLNQIVVKTNLPFAKVSANIIEMELKDIVVNLSGGKIKLKKN